MRLVERELDDKPQKFRAVADVWLIDLKVHQDDRGLLFEVLHDYDLVSKGNARFGQVYIVRNPAPFTVRAFHRHRELWDYFSIIHGAAKFVLVNPGKYSARVLTLTEWRPQLLIVPPGCWHGWMSLVPDTILLCTGSEVYNSADPDEERVPPDEFDYLFDGKSVWEVEGR